MNLRSLADVPDEFPPTNLVEKPEVEPVGELSNAAPRVVHTLAESLVFTPSWGGAQADEININILALDLGTHTGFALRSRDGSIIHGTESFTPRASWAPGQRWQRFRSWLSTTITENHIQQIAFEDVLRHGPNQVLAAHVYGGFRAMMEMVADSHRVELVGLGVGQIKKHWTGAGNAKKDAMIAHAKRRGYHPVDDNNADALAILDLAVARETGAWKPTPKRPKKASRQKHAAPAQDFLWEQRQ